MPLPGASMPKLEPVKDLKVQFNQLFINNDWMNAASGKTFPVINPATGQTIAECQEAGPEDVDKAVAAARHAFKRGSPWRKMDASQRGVLLGNLADLLKRDAAVFATLESMDVGKPFMPDSCLDQMIVQKWLRYFAGLADKIEGRTIPMDGDFFAYTKVQPVGVVGAITPWNFPFVAAIWKVSAALAAGCTVVLKPSEVTPLTTLRLASLIKEAGFPPGVVNVVTGMAPAGNALARHMDVDKVTFTGSTQVGRLVMKAAAESNLKKVTLELGGKSPCIVLADADIDFAAMMAHNSVFINMGQVCVSGSRTFVQEEIYDDFVNRLVSIAQKRKVGDPFDSETQSGPQISEPHLNKILSLVESGKQEGAKLMCGGERYADRKGYFMKPTVFANVTDDMRIAKEEIFGPVQQIIKFKNIEEVIPRANNTPYGLAASVFTKDIDKALTIAHNIDAGIVWVNCTHAVGPQTPFGGFKESGIGKEHGEEGIKEYCELKTVIVKIPEKNS